MRDPERIWPVLMKLHKYWLRHPDLRLAQIVGNALEKGNDPYNMEDDYFEAKLDEWLENDNLEWLGDA